MNKTLTAVLGLALMLAYTVPVMQANEETNRDANIAWLLERRADMPLDAPVTVHAGGVAQEMTLLEVAELFGDRSERLNIPALIFGASHAPSSVLAGDVWILEDSFTPGACPTATVLAPSPLPATPANEQLYIYGGPEFVLHDDAHSDVAARPGDSFGIHIGWTTKEEGDHTGSESSLIGSSDLWCVDWGTFGTTWFPWANGVAYTG